MIVQPQNKYIRFIIRFLVVYIFWSYFITKTIYSSTELEYAGFILLFGLFVFAIFIVDVKKVSCNKILLLWMPYLIFTCLEYLYQGKYESFFYWMIALLMVLFSICFKMHCVFPVKLIYFFAAFSAIGILVQLVFPSFYYDNISCIFITSNQIYNWGKNYGLAGFAYQLDYAGMPILWGEVVYLSFAFKSDRDISIALKDIFIILGFVFFVFLSGKRMLFFISILLPFVIVYISQRYSRKKIGFAIALVICLIFAYMFLMKNLELLYINPMVSRYAVTITKWSAGEEYNSGRRALAKLAIKLFEENKLFGVGVSNYQRISGAYTDVHNTYLQILCEQGIFGFILYIIPLVFNLNYALKAIKKYGETSIFTFIKLSICGQVLYIVYAFSGNVNINLTGYLLYFMAISIMYSAIYESSNVGETVL